MTKIAVVGCRKGQSVHILRQCPGVKIRFVDADRGGAKMPSADHIIMWTRFISHKMTDKTRSRFHRDRIHNCTGGIGDIIDKIKGLT